MSIKHYERKKKWKLRSFNQHRPLAEYLTPLIGDKKSVSILDAGAGPILTTGDMLSGVDVNITACDNLADEYHKIYGELLFPVEQQNIEKMAYADNSFDIAHCVNALDHTKSPRSAIAELQRVAKNYVYLRHYPNEGERQKYSGLHRWNIQLEGDDCLFWNKKRKFYLSEFGDWKHSVTDDGQIVSIYALL